MPNESLRLKTFVLRRAKSALFAMTTPSTFAICVGCGLELSFALVVGVADLLSLLGVGVADLLSLLGVGVADAIAFLLVGVGNGSVGFGVGKDSFLLKTSVF